MFEQVLIPASHSHQGRCAVFALTGEVGIVAIATLMMAYSDVVPFRLPETAVPLILSPPPSAAMTHAPAGTVERVVPKPLIVVPKPFIAPTAIPQHALIISDAEPPLQNVEAEVPGGVYGRVPGGSLNGLLASLPAPVAVAIPPKPAATPPAPTTPKQIRVGGELEEARLTHEVLPVYPPLAKRSRIGGTVRFSAIIAPDGTVKDLHLVSGHPLLVEAAANAVKQWVYRPTYLNGLPVEVVTEIDVRFRLV